MARFAFLGTVACVLSDLIVFGSLHQCISLGCVSHELEEKASSDAGPPVSLRLLAFENATSSPSTVIKYTHFIMGDKKITAL